jgi:hypothetical protein
MVPGPKVSDRADLKSGDQVVFWTAGLKIHMGFHLVRLLQVEVGARHTNLHTNLVRSLQVVWETAWLPHNPIFTWSRFRLKAVEFIGRLFLSSANINNATKSKSKP